MNETQLVERKSTLLVKGDNAPNQTIEVLPQESSSPAVPQTPPDEKWDTIRHGIYVAGTVVIFSVAVLGTRGRTVKISGSIGPLKFVTTLSRSVAAAA